MKLSDYVVEFISRYTKRVFMVAGGGAMHLNDSLGSCKELEYHAMMHEQGAALSACGYGQVTNQLGVCMVTTGPGSTNAVTGCLAAWMDSIPVLFISGQVQTSQMVGESGLRYKGSQEVDIVSIVEPITKYAITVYQPSEIRWALGRAVHEAMHGRKGPVWVDIPLDIQAAEIDPSTLEMFKARDDSWEDIDNIVTGVERIKSALEKSKKPVILAGHGIIAAGAQDEFYKLIARFKCPVLLTWKAIGLLSDVHPSYCGRPGMIGQYAANRIQQGADLLLVIGACMNFDQTAYQLARVAPEAVKVVVDIDRAELAKYPEGWVKIHADIGQFFEYFHISGEYGEWLKACKQLGVTA